MTGHENLKRRLMQEIGQWVRSQDGPQKELGRRLRMTQSEISLLLRGQGRFTVGRLMDIWERSGGTIEVSLGRSRLERLLTEPSVLETGR